MNKINFSRARTSYDGTPFTKEKLEDWFCREVEGDICIRLDTITTSHYIEDRVKNFIKINIHKLLFASPKKLSRYTEIVDNYFSGLFRNTSGHRRKTDFGKDILKAFNYDGYRDNVLVKLAEKLNVKTCPYCNMHYTLFAEKEETKEDDGEIDKLAKFQFDHFFDKSDYPFLSMSLYNLIPSCAVCNQGKSTHQLSLRFHPYHSAICEQFHFEVKNPRPLINGARPKNGETPEEDKIEIKIVEDKCSKSELDDFDKTFHIKTLYSRHKDIAQETFDKAYVDSYYLNPKNFKFLENADPDYLKRLWMGTYPSTDEIEKRPMTKFIQDLWNQAKQLKDDL